MHLTAQSREFCWRKWVPIPAFRRIHHRQHNHIRRIFNRRLAEKEAACYGENCRVQSDSQSQRENYGGSKSWILAQHAQAIAKILGEAFDEVNAAGVAAFFFGPLDTAEFDAGATVSLLPLHAAAHQIFSEGFDVETEFRVHLVFHARPPQHGAQPGPQSIQQPHTFSSRMRKLPVIIAVLTRILALPSDPLASLAALASKLRSALPPTGLQTRRRNSVGRPSRLQKAKRSAIAWLQRPVPRRTSRRSVPRRIPAGEKVEPRLERRLQAPCAGRFQIGRAHV